MNFEDLKIKDILANEDLMAIVKRFIPDWDKFPVGLLKNKKVEEVIKLAKNRGLCTDADVAEFKAEVEKVLGK